MKDINTIYRDAVATANAEQRTMLAEASKTFTEATRTYLEAVEAAAKRHLEAVSAAEIAWKAASEIKIAQFEGEEDKTKPVELPRIDPKELKNFEQHLRESSYRHDKDTGLLEHGAETSTIASVDAPAYHGPTTGWF